MPVRDCDPGVGALVGRIACRCAGLACRSDLLRPGALSPSTTNAPANTTAPADRTMSRRFGRLRSTAAIPAPRSSPCDLPAGRSLSPETCPAASGAPSMCAQKCIGANRLQSPNSCAKQDQWISANVIGGRLNFQSRSPCRQRSGSRSSGRVSGTKCPGRRTPDLSA